MLPDAVQDKLETLPPSPGVYVFRDRAGKVLYVGKALNLRSRVRSYFQPGAGDVRAFVARLEGELGDIETYVVETEKEAALLENQVIKEHRPRYNVKLRDDKDYLSLRLDPSAAWPRLEVVRRPKPDRALYFGPYHSATAARQTLRLVNRHFQLRTCTDSDFRSRTRPCLQHQIRRCPAPCVKEVDRDEYDQQVRNVAMFLQGRHDELVAELEARMERASAAMEYEQAAVHRDQLRAVERVREEQRVAAVKDVDQDVVGLYRQADQAEVAVLHVRNGKLIGVRTFELGDVSLPEAELLASFVSAYYERGGYIPDEILLPAPIEAMEGLAALLTDKRSAQGPEEAPPAVPDGAGDPRPAPTGGRQRKVKVQVPQRGARAKLLRMAQDNAAHAFNEKRRAEQDVEERLGQVQRRLGLPQLPRRIECVDVSHIGGQDTVAVVVALRDGAPDRKRYRSFHVKRVGPGDDYGAMYEVLSRRFRRGRDAQQGWELPDLLVVDGGKGQLNVALAALRDLGVADMPVAALAKEKEDIRGDKLVDRVYLPGRKNPIALKSSPALAMLALARDEAHRASNALRLKRGKRRSLRSALEDVPGVGAKTRAKLLKSLGSLRVVQSAGEQELVEAGATRRQARAIREAFQGTVPADAAPPATAELDEQPDPATRPSQPEPSGRPDADEAEDRAVDNAFVADPD